MQKRHNKLKLPILKKTVWDNNSEHTPFCLVLKRPLRQMSSANENNRDFSGNDVMEKIIRIFSVFSIGKIN